MKSISTFRSRKCGIRYQINLQGAQAAARARQLGGLDPVDPICVYDLCDHLGVTVRFSAINMEGMYDREPKPRIHLSSLRPFGRRAFNCAHELGHHTAGHGTTIDRLQASINSTGAFSPDEILANAFAANLLMPSPGIKKALRIRNLSLEAATPVQIYAVACNFGVGYSTFVEHLHSSLGLLSPAAKLRLLRSTPKSIRAEVLGAGTSAHLRIVDGFWTGCPVDAEINDLILSPLGTTVSDNIATLVDETSFYRLFRCGGPGIGSLSLPGNAGTHFLRVQNSNYIGLARFRHLEVSE